MPTASNITPKSVRQAWEKPELTGLDMALGDVLNLGGPISDGSGRTTTSGGPVSV